METKNSPPAPLDKQKFAWYNTPRSNHSEVMRVVTLNRDGLPHGILAEVFTTAYNQPGRLPNCVRRENVLATAMFLNLRVAAGTKSAY
ncbi:MAG: hypothetical protein FWE60_05690 [Oscillospiraceae bacterium]|nr:hypothetical protein [Oscillospiraceae bacterium]